MDGNEAAAYIAYKTNEVCAIYPITPASSMGELVDEWSAEGKTNIWGDVPKVVEMQSEAGAAGAVHGVLQAGALSTTFTASQGLLLMFPNMYKIAGELLPNVIHIASRALATHALSIFGDHSDAMAARTTGYAMLFGSSPQEAMDFSLIAQAVTLKSRIPFLNIFDGFRTSHELNKVEIIPDEIIRQMIDEQDVQSHKLRGMNPNNPVVRGTAQNPDVFFQNREASNVFYQRVPVIVEQMMERFEKLTGRKYNLMDYHGHPEAEKVIVIMGSGAQTVKETVEYLNIKKGQKTGVLIVRLFQPFSVGDMVAALPSTVKNIAVLDRCKEPGAVGEPLLERVMNALMVGFGADGDSEVVMPSIIGGRYGLSSKEFTPAMVKAIYDELDEEFPRDNFTVGINDDVTHLSLDYDKEFSLEDQHEFRGLFFGLGADGTVSANKNSIKIIGETTDKQVQGYFVYDSKKSGSLTVSHLRFGKHLIQSPYLIQSANFVACHQFGFLNKFDILEKVEKGAKFLLNSPFPANEVWNVLPAKIQQEIIEKELELYVMNASEIARECELGTRINTILQVGFFKISNILPIEEAVEKIKESIIESYGHKGDKIISRNNKAVDLALENVYKVDYPKEINGPKGQDLYFPSDTPDFVKEILSKIMIGKGDDLPVSAMPVDGTFPTGTTKYEKRGIAAEVPVWDEAICSQCNKCLIVCPHAAIRVKVYDKAFAEAGPETMKHVPPIGKEFNKETEAYTLQLSPDDCTGCILCVEVCPITNKENPDLRAINMVPVDEVREVENKNWEYFNNIPEFDRSRVNKNTVKGTQFLQPLFEFSGACSGCGETPYLKLISQLFGDRLLIANATGCSSIYGGNLPTTPWTTNNEGRGPAWANSLFEDNAEFGLGIHVANKFKKESAFNYLKKIKHLIGEELTNMILNTNQATEEGVEQQRKNVEELKEILREMKLPEANIMLAMADHLVKRSIWIIGGDGWAYDIGYGGLDHVLSSGENVNILVLDTEVYSNTGGQTSKSTPRGATAKFSVAGKAVSKKDLPFMAISYGNAYVAQISLGANDMHTVKVMNEAEAYDGPSLIIAYSPCIAHGYDMCNSPVQSKHAVEAGYWPLFRFNPMLPEGKRFTIDSKNPTLELNEFMYKEGRYQSLRSADPVHAEELLHLAEDDIKNRWKRLEMLKML